MTVDAFDLFLPVPGPERPEHKIGPIRRREQRQAIDAAVFPDPVSGLHMIGMRIFGKSGRLGLLRGEEALLLLGEIEEPPRRFSVRLGHSTILQLSCCFVTTEIWRHRCPRKLRSRQHYAFSALFPEIRELPTMTGLLDLERQGYGFRAAKLCFKAHWVVNRGVCFSMGGASRTTVKDILTAIDAKTASARKNRFRNEVGYQDAVTHLGAAVASVYASV